MVELEKSGFDTTAFLAQAGLGRRISQLAPKDAFFSQGDPADSIFYLQKGRAKVTVVSASGRKLAVVMHPDRCHAKSVQGPNSTENADNADATEIVQPPYFL